MQATTNEQPVIRAGLPGLTAFCESVGLVLEPFQKRIAGALHGPAHEVVVLMPRGQGKSALIGAYAVHHLLTTPRASVYVAASSREQAAIVYAYAREYAETADAGIVLRHLELRAPDGGRLKVLASDAPKLHGLTPSLSIIDEFHAHSDDAVYVAMRTAMLKRPGSRLVTISSAGQGSDSPLGRLRARALALPNVTRKGALTDAHGPGLRMLEWAVPEDCDVDDAHEVKKANPASWVTRAGLREQRGAVPDLAYRRYHANQWTQADGSWLPAGAWQACIGEPAFEDGEAIWIGVDVGGERSASAVVWINAGLHVGAAIYHGDAGVLECVDQVRDLAGRYNVREVAFDPWRFGQAAQELARERITVLEFPQTDVRMVPASLRLHAAIVEQRLTLPDDRELASHAAHTIAKHSRRGWRIDKASPRDNMDAVVALAMALERAEQPTPEPVRFVGWL